MASLKLEPQTTDAANDGVEKKWGYRQWALPTTGPRTMDVTADEANDDGNTDNEYRHQRGCR